VPECGEPGVTEGERPLRKQCINLINMPF